MNKKLIALFVAAAASTSVTAAEVAKTDNATLEIGGRAEARMAFKDGNTSDLSRARVNVLGKTKITEELYGLGFYEGEFKATRDNATSGTQKNEALENRYIYAGIGGNFGEVTMGTVEGSLQKVTDFTDIMSFHGAQAAKKTYSADRPAQSIAYTGEFSGLELRANYTFESPKAGNTKKKDNGYALSAIYNIGETGVRVTGAFAADNASNSDEKASQYMLGASYTFDDFYVAGLFNKADAKTGGNKSADINGYELAAAYTMGQAKFTTTYNRAENKKASEKKFVDEVAVDATYFFSANFRTYASYKFDLIKDAKNEAVLGLRYDF